MDEIYIEVVNYEEQEDGSALITLDLNEPARTMLIGEGLKAIIMDHINNMEEFKDEKGSCGGACCSHVSD